jgi:hypothetical protein
MCESAPLPRRLDQQNAALEAAGVTKTFSDTMSGARDLRRKALTSLILAWIEG